MEKSEKIFPSRDTIASEKVFEILLNDYKSLKLQRLVIFVIKYVVSLLLITLQIMADSSNKQQLLLVIVLFLSLTSIYFKDSTLAAQIRRINSMITDFNNEYFNSYELKKIQELRYYEQRDYLRHNIYNFLNFNNFLEYSIWIVLSVFIFLLKVYQVPYNFNIQ